MGSVSRLRERGNLVMPRTHRWIALGFWLVSAVLIARTASAQTGTPQTATPPQAVDQTNVQAKAQTNTQTSAQHATHPRHKSHKTPKPLVLPPLPSGPLSQLPMDQIPPTPAKVSYQGGMLTISAQNSTLGEILRDVRKLTGASIEIPPGSGANERVIVSLGPGAPRDVLARLLNGSSFDYVMLGSNSDPGAVSSVMLMAKPSAAGETQTATNVYQNDSGGTPANNFPHPQPFNPQIIALQPGNGRPVAGQPGSGQPANADTEDKDDDSDNNDDNADDQAQPSQPDANAANGQDQQPDANQPNAGPKTPEQILEMLRRPQQPGAAAPAPPPQD
jgi:hypothetical protein